MSDFELFVDIGKIHNHIKKLPKEFLIHKILKRLLGLKFKLDHSIKLKALKYVVNKMLPDL